VCKWRLQKSVHWPIAIHVKMGAGQKHQPLPDPLWRCRTALNHSDPPKTPSKKRSTSHAS
jgi:hypothetical protein